MSAEGLKTMLVQSFNLFEITPNASSLEELKGSYREIHSLYIKDKEFDPFYRGGVEPVVLDENEMIDASFSFERAIDEVLSKSERIEELAEIEKEHLREMSSQVETSGTINYNDYVVASNITNEINNTTDNPTL